MSASDDGNWASAVPQSGSKHVNIDDTSHDGDSQSHLRRRDTFRQLSLVNREIHHAPTLPLLLVTFVAILALLSGFLVAGMHKAIIYSGCPLGINGCNDLNKKYEKYGFKLNKALEDHIPEEAIYIMVAVVGAFLCGQIIAWLPEHLSNQLTGGGTPQALVAVATGELIPWKAALLRATVSILFLSSGGSLGSEGPAIQVCTSFVMLLGWVAGIRSAVTLSLLASLGFSCGFAASFNAPVAGIIFAMEELQHVSTRLNQSTIYIIILASVVSTSVSRLTASNSTLLHANWSQEIIDGVAGGSIQQVYGYHMWLLISIPIGIMCSLVGYAISVSCNLLRRRFGERVQRLPLSLVLVVQALLTASAGAAVFKYTGLRGVWGIGAESLQKIFDHKLKEGFTGIHFLVFALGKALALVLGIFVRAPADILEPVLITGGFIGGAVGTLLPEDPLVVGSDAMTPCVIFGMVGLFASCFRFPLTPVVIVLEITGVESYTIILPAALCAFTAVTCSNWCFPALLDDVLLQEGIDLELLAEEAEEHFTEREREKQDDREDSEEDDAEPPSPSNAVPRGRPRSASVYSNQSSLHLVIRDIENSLLAQSRSQGSPQRSHASSPNSSRRPSFAHQVNSRRPSNESSRAPSRIPAPSLVGSRRPSDASISSRHPSKLPAPSLIGSRRPSNASAYSLPQYQRLDSPDQSPYFEVPMQSFAFQNGMPGGAINLRLAVHQDPNSVEPSFLLEVQPSEPVSPRSQGSKTRPPLLRGQSTSSGFNLDQKIDEMSPIGYVLAGVQEGRPSGNSTMSKESEQSQPDEAVMASVLPGVVDTGKTPSVQSVQESPDIQTPSIQPPVAADQAAASAFNALHVAERLAGACSEQDQEPATEQAQEPVLQPGPPVSAAPEGLAGEGTEPAQPPVLQPTPPVSAPSEELRERPGESANSLE